MTAQEWAQFDAEHWKKRGSELPIGALANRAVESRGKCADITWRRQYRAAFLRAMDHDGPPAVALDKIQLIRTTFKELTIREQSTMLAQLIHEHTWKALEYRDGPDMRPCRSCDGSGISRT